MSVESLQYPLSPFTLGRDVSERGEPAVSAEPVLSGSGCQWSVSVESLQYPLTPFSLGRDVSVQ